MLNYLVTWTGTWVYPDAHMTILEEKLKINFELVGR